MKYSREEKLILVYWLQAGDYPMELDILLGKKMFKVEVTDDNLMHNWRNYTAKRVSDDIGIIKQFMELKLR
jgi:hypothetical protein